MSLNNSSCNCQAKPQTRIRSLGNLLKLGESSVRDALVIHVAHHFLCFVQLSWNRVDRFAQCSQENFDGRAHSTRSLYASYFFSVLRQNMVNLGYFVAQSNNVQFNTQDRIGGGIWYAQYCLIQSGRK